MQPRPKPRPITSPDRPCLPDFLTRVEKHGKAWVRGYITTMFGAHALCDMAHNFDDLYHTQEQIVSKNVHGAGPFFSCLAHG